MSGYDGRTQGKRFRKRTTGNSNLHERWKHLSAEVEDVIDGAPPSMKKGDRHRRQSGVPAMKQSVAAVDIDGDGKVDVREMRLAKVLDAMIETRQRANPNTAEISERELNQMRQHAGKLLIAKEFIERNQGQLWRYAFMFAEKNEDQSAEFIAEHRKFPKIMAFLESMERKRVMRSSRHIRELVNQDPHCEQPNFQRQTCVESVRKVNSAPTSKFLLPELQPKSREIHPYQQCENNTGDEYNSSGVDVLTNEYGALDVDGDGVVDGDEMKLYMRLQEATLDDTAGGEFRSPKALRKMQQLDGRRMMARDFVTRNADTLWLYSPSFKGRANDEIVEEIGSHEHFAKELNKLRSKERVLTLKSSLGVAGCIAQTSLAELPNDPQNPTEFRRVRDRTELLMARRELMKPPDQRMAALLAKTGMVPGTVPSLPFGSVREARQIATPMNRARSEGLLTGLPKIYDAPQRLEPTGCFSVTKWKSGGL